MTSFYRYYNDIVTDCKKKCRLERPRSTALFSDDESLDSSDLSFYERAVRNALCIMKCKREIFGKDRVEQVSVETIKDFEEKNPYNYLQLCHYQVRSKFRTQSQNVIELL